MPQSIVVPEQIIHITEIFCFIDSYFTIIYCNCGRISNALNDFISNKRNSFS